MNSTPLTENDVKLQMTSPAIGAGADLGLSLRSILDPQGTAVPFGTYDQSSAWMMGAFGHAKQTMTKIAGDNQSNAVNSVFPTPLQVSIKDSDGNPVPGATVTFSVVAGSSGASGTFGSSATITTDSNGSATAPDLTSNSVAGQFTVTATHGGLSATFTLTNVDGPQISLTPSSVSFGSLDVNTTSAAQTITLSNTSTGALSITSISVTGPNAADFSQTNNCGSSVAAGASCTMSVTFSPQAAGTRSASLTVTDDAADSPQTAALAGTGVAVAQVSLTPSSVSFANQNVSTSSAAQTITLSNAGSGALSIASVAITGTNAADFSQTNTCGTSVAAGANCSISVTFTPQAAGARSASVIVTDNAAGSPHTAALSGTGTSVAQVSLSPSTLSFGNQNVSTSSAAQTITLSNGGSGALSITSIAITGTNIADFSQTNTCGTSVAAGANCSISVTFTPQAAGARSGSVTVTDNAAGSPHTAALSGTGAGVAQVSLSPSTLSFGNQNVSTTSAVPTITLSNTGSGALSITSVAITGTNAADFGQTNTCGSSVAVGANCTISVTFTPQAAGTRSASLTITDDAAGSPQSAALTGSGVGVAQISLTPAALSFAGQNVKTASAPQTITLSNGGSGALSITSIAITGTNIADFSQTNTCGTSVAAGASCRISVTFTPQAAGARSASATVTDNATGSPHSAALTGSGVGVAQVSLSPSSLSFGNQNVKTASAVQTIALSNAGSGALSITSITITGTNATDFGQTNTCGTSVAAGASCTISITFTPQAAGARSASVIVTDSAAGSPHAAALSGTGVGVAQVSLTPATLSFGNQNVKTASAPQTITLSNGGSGALSITGMAITGTNATEFGQTNTCGTSVAAGASCTISVTFTPQAAGARSASLSITDNAAGSPHTAALSGTGVAAPQISLSPSTLAFGNQNVRTVSSARTVTLSNGGSGALSITSIAISGTNVTDFSQTNTCGTSVAAGASCTISVTFTPQAAGTRSASVTVTDSAAGSPHTAPLSGTGIASPQVSLTPSSLAFGNQKVKATSSARTITLSNAGSAALSITSIAFTGTNTVDFSQTNTCGTGVAAGGSCTISVKFTPQAAGARSASLTVTDNAAGSPHRAALSGIGIPITLTPTTVAFGNQRLKTASSARTVTLSNIGTSAVSITRIAFTGTNAADFSQTNTCGTSVAAGGSCTISVKFTPQAAGTRSASLAVTDNAVGSPHTAALSGTGVPITLTPSTLAFGNQKVKIASTARTITLANIGTAAVSITRIAFTGTNAADFSQTNNCGTSVAAGGSCTISVKFTPQATGARSASLSVTDNAAGSPHTAGLSGTGTP